MKMTEIVIKDESVKKQNILKDVNEVNVDGKNIRTNFRNKKIYVIKGID